MTPQTRIVDRPEPAFLRTRLVRGGPWVPAIIYSPCPWVEPSLDVPVRDWCWPLGERRPMPLRAQLGDEPVEDDGRIAKLWNFGVLIEAAEYRWRVSLRDWAEAYAPALPEANPQRRIELGQQRALF